LVTGSSVHLQSVVAGTPPTATLRMVPVPAKVGSYPPGTSIIGNELRLNAGGVRAWFEFQALNWDPNRDNIPRLGGFQVKIDSTGYMDSDAPGDQPDLAPPVIPCASYAVCVAAFGSSARCGLGTCEAAYGRLCDTSSLNFTCVTFAWEVRDDGTPLYGGTVVLDIPPGAEGKYTVNLNTDETFMWDSASPPNDLPTLSETGFVVNIVPCTGPADCSDGLFCNGQETCDLGTGLCVAGTPPSCTAPTPTCDEATDTCTGCTGPADCPDDGLFCNGAESCNLTSGLCTQSGNPCLPNQICDEDTDACLDFGACCLDMGTVCFETNEPDCVDPPPNGAGGVFLGAGSTCPQQNAQIIAEGNGTVFVHVVGPPVDCPAPGLVGAVAGCPPSGPYTDPWVSDESAGLCHNFGSPDTDPIPAGFFDPGSDPFTSAVCLRGVPLGVPQYGDADTLISRSADPFDRCDLPSGTSSTVDIEIVALSLESVDPITVTYNGGSNPETWNVTVDLSPGGLPPSTPPRTLTATKSHCNGGTYTSVLYVQPRFTFTKVSNPSEVRVLDTGMTGTPPVELVQSDPHPWVSDIDPFLGAMVDLCSDFHANISESNPLLECDCNANSRRDLCDIEEGVSLDCNANGVPDSCDLSNGTSQDVNGNGVPDECDPPGNIVWDANDLSTDRTTRSLRFRVEGKTDPSLEDAIRVTMVDLQTPVPPNAAGRDPQNFHAWDVGSPAACASCTAEACPADPSSGQGGCARWVGRPGTFLEAQDFPLGASYQAARLQCSPFYTDWVAVTATNPITVVGAEIMPSSTYSVQAYGASCLGNEGTCTNVSAAVTMYTRRSSDVAAVYNPPGTTTQPDAIDVTEVLNKFTNKPMAPVKARAQVQPNLLELNGDINGLDIVAVVDGVKGFAYPYGGPCPCPSLVTCGPGTGSLPCSGGVGACTGSGLPGLGAGAMCVKTCSGGDNPGAPCINNGHCKGTPPTPDGTCGNPFCRDKCGRCTP
jgi:hypothetical protein